MTPAPELRDRLNSAKGAWTAIRATSGLSYSWLSKFGRDLIPNPGITTLSRLRQALDALPDKSTQ